MNTEQKLLVFSLLVLLVVVIVVQPDAEGGQATPLVTAVGTVHGDWFTPTPTVRPVTPWPTSTPMPTLTPTATLKPVFPLEYQTATP